MVCEYLKISFVFLFVTGNSYCKMSKSLTLEYIRITDEGNMIVDNVSLCYLLYMCLMHHYVEFNTAWTLFYLL